MSREKESVNPFTVVIIIVSILMIGSMVRNALSLYGARQRLDASKQAVATLENQKKQFIDQIAIETDPAALDQAIRNKLNLIQPGETTIVISGSASAQVGSDLTIIPTPTKIPPFIKWWTLFNPEN